MSAPGIEIVNDLCQGCTLCVKACPFGAISMHERKAVIDYDACTLCGACVSICERFGAIVSHLDEAGHSLTDGGDVWVLAEVTSCGRLSHPSAELLGKARQLAARLGVNACAVILGQQILKAAHEALHYGATAVYVGSSEALRDFKDEPYCRILARAIKVYRPQIVLGAATAIGRAVLPRVAILCETGLTADCTGLDIDPASGLLLQTRPAFGGNIMATIQCRTKRPQMATVRPGVFHLPERVDHSSGRMIELPVEKEDLASGIEWLDAVSHNEGSGGLRDAEIIVTAGAGVGGPDGVSLVAQLAHAMGGILGASRAVVDAGWAAYAHQIGQSGSTVQPRLYVACGVSGAVQHIVGMQNSETIVAINRDSDAPIFKFADIAIVGDVMDIVPAILRKLKHHSP